jgi:sugar O-acyltransferase (sialic acid O-acetyltransferase NeuD family)
MRIELLTLLGAGGHAKVVCDAVLTAGIAVRVEVKDDDVRLAGAELLGLRILVPIGPLEVLGQNVHVAIGNNRARADLSQRLCAATRQLTTIMHPHATLSVRCEVADGTFVAAHAVVGPGATVGKCAIINHGAIIDHDSRVGAWAHIAPNAILGGGVQVGEGTLIGAGAAVLPGVSVGKWATVGAGAVVTTPVPDGETVIGIPARRFNRA